MKTYNVGEVEITIEKRTIHQESSIEWCVYYTVYLTNKEGKEFSYLDYDFFNTNNIVEDDVFNKILQRKNPFEDAIDVHGNSIRFKVFVNFLGKDWFDQWAVLQKMLK